MTEKSRQRTFTENVGPLKTFSDEARDKLENHGYLILPLSGRPAAAFYDLSRSFLPDLLRVGNPVFAHKLLSLRSEVAVNPREFLLPESNYKTFSEQSRMVRNLAANLAHKFKLKENEIATVIGEVPDYAEIMFNLEGKSLPYTFFNHRLRRLRTATISSPEFKIEIGYHGAPFPEHGGLSFSSVRDSASLYNTWIAPMVLPK